MRVQAQVQRHGPDRTEAQGEGIGVVVAPQGLGRTGLVDEMHAQKRGTKPQKTRKISRSMGFGTLTKINLKFFLRKESSAEIVVKDKM